MSKVSKKVSTANVDAETIEIMTLQHSKEDGKNNSRPSADRAGLVRTVYAIIILATPLILFASSQVIHIPEPLLHFLMTIIAVLFVHLLDRWWLLRDTLDELNKIKQYIASNSEGCVAAITQSHSLQLGNTVSEIKQELAQLDYEMKSRMSTTESIVEQGVDSIKAINYTSAFLAPQIQISDDEPHLVAYLSTGRNVTLQHLKSMAEKVKHLAEGSPIEISDVPVIGHFLTNLVSSMDNLRIDQKIVWLGTSLAVNPTAWSISNRVLADYQLSLLNRIKNETIIVYRLFTIDSRLSEATNWKEKLETDELKKQAKEGIKVKLLIMQAPPVGFSLVCIPTRDSCEMLNPSDEWDDMENKGWKVICGIEWMIRGYTYVEGARIWPQNTPWIRERYKDFYRFWQAEEATEILP